MTDVAIVLVVLLGLALVGLAVVTGHAPDTRDPTYGLGALLTHPRHDGE